MMEENFLIYHEKQVGFCVYVAFAEYKRIPEHSIIAWKSELTIKINLASCTARMSVNDTAHQ